MYVIYGLDSISGVPPGSFAFMLKMHHAAVDGVAGAELVTALMQATPDELPRPASGVWAPEKPPSYLGRLVYAGFQTLVRPVASSRLFLQAATTGPRTMVEMTRQAWRSGQTTASTGTRFNGNRFAMSVVPLGTDIADPLRRLTVTRERTSAAKGYGVGTLTLMEASEALPGALMGTAQRAVVKLVSRTGRSMGGHTIVTNVPGPRTPMYFCGARCVFQSGMAPVVDGMGLIIGVGSYCDEFFFSWTADRDQMPDPRFFGDRLRQEFEAMITGVTLAKDAAPAQAVTAARRARPARPAD
jgi:WS/DGAT C-terminal domain/Wax ester synthase-like Acyl-CoA acyltransferase domain